MKNQIDWAYRFFQLFPHCYEQKRAVFFLLNNNSAFGIMESAFPANVFKHLNYRRAILEKEL